MTICKDCGHEHMWEGYCGYQFNEPPQVHSWGWSQRLECLCKGKEGLDYYMKGMKNGTV